MGRARHKKGGSKAAWRKGKSPGKRKKGPPTPAERKAAAERIQARERGRQARQQEQARMVAELQAKRRAEEKAAFFARQNALGAPSRPKTSGQATEFLHQIEDNFEDAELRMGEIRQVFDQHDRDGSNTIDKDEAVQILESLGLAQHDVSFEELLTLFDDHDNDGSDHLDFDEFVRFHNEAVDYKQNNTMVMVPETKC